MCVCVYVAQQLTTLSFVEKAQRAQPAHVARSWKGFFLKHVEVTQYDDRLFMVESDPLAGHSKVKGLKRIFLCSMRHIESATG